MDSFVLRFFYELVSDNRTQKSQQGIPSQSSLVSIVSSKYSRLSKQCVHSIWFYKNQIIFKEDLLPFYLVSTYFNMSGEIQNLHLVHGIQQPNLKLRIFFILWSTNLNFSAKIWRGWSMVLVPNSNICIKDWTRSCRISSERKWNP